jgi:serine acetyltransferase/acyl-coenzyme A synthetase/AMP-(fatty) acid ligase
MEARFCAGHSVVGVVAVNSCDYIKRMLDNLARGVVSVPLRGAQDQERINRARVGAVVEPRPGGGWLSQPFTSTPSGDLSQISFTSGTEGAPKAVLLSRANLHDAIVRLQAAMRLDGEVREYVGVPVYHSFGYGRCRAVLNAGGQCYLPAAGFDLVEVRQLLVEGRINAISAVPSLWRVFLANQDLFGDELARVRWVEIGSQHMAADEKAQLRQALPNACIVQHYGLTEASRTTLLRVHEVEAHLLASVGRPEGAVAVRISAQERIEIRGPHVALAIMEGDGLREYGSDAWLETSDMGTLEQGFLFFHGRADDVINLSGAKLSPDVLEAALRRDLGIQGDFCVARRPDPVRGEGILLALTPATVDRQRELIDRLAELLEAQGVAARSAIAVRVVEQLPQTATGKVQRSRLAAAAESTAPSAPAPASGTDDLDTWLRQRLGPGALDGEATFHDLGGDSLMHLELSLRLERSLGRIPGGWENRSLRELVRLAQAAAPFPSRPGRAPALPRGDRNENPPGIGFWALVREDYRTNDANALGQGFLMLLIHRFGNWRMGIRIKILRAPLTLLYRFLNKMAQIACGMKLDYTVKVGRRVKLEHFGGMILGARAIGDDVFIRQNTTFGVRSVDDLNAKPTIGSRVDIGAGAVIVGDITIGDNSIIGANAVVYMNIPPNSIVSGVPGRIVGANPRQNPSPLADRR